MLLKEKGFDFERIPDSPKHKVKQGLKKLLFDLQKKPELLMHLLINKKQLKSPVKSPTEKSLDNQLPTQIKNKTESKITCL